MGSKNTDLVARQKFRKKLVKWGMDPVEINLCVEQMRQRQLDKKVGKLDVDAPICTRAEYVRLLKKQSNVDPKGAIVLRLGEDYEPPSDVGYKPTAVDAVLQGTGRAVGATAKAVKKRKTMTKYEHDRLTKGSDV